ncbi:hypothetical protein FBF48_10405 [Streptococcus salivarius]|uniref:Uncharacterized protein n=1 Tax=Streptococcus salivarius TaxID=1304 RepID=A0AAX2V0F9_STRSL|nr:hypothetical protein [Streptococcus salivarius]TNF65645.1 hypothetical protein FBF48_10405 [Streptococcus salivarius]
MGAAISVLAYAFIAASFYFGKFTLTVIGILLWIFGSYAIDKDIYEEWTAEMTNRSCKVTEQRAKRVTAFVCPDGVIHYSPLR